jgi:undecaprenyl-diphosphatase
MNADQGIFAPLLLGIVEGLTEFLPVSSTAHLLLIGHFLGFESPGRAFEVMIQLGAILAIVVAYFGRLVALIRQALGGGKEARRFILGIILASLPAAIAGVVLHDFIKGVLYESPIVISIALILGGLVLLFVDQMRLSPKYTEIERYPLPLAFAIGLCQMLALLPGVSRSGATIVGALLMGTDKRSAAEFTFYLALPIMIGAFGYDAYKNRELIAGGLGLDIAIGFVAAFVTALVVVRWLLGYVSKHGFALFAYWRIFLGAAALWGVLLFK